MKPPVLVAAFLAAFLIAGLAQAQQENAAGLPRLDPIATVDDVQHSVWASAQTLNAISFMLQHGSTIRLKQVLYPNYENGLTPGYVFTPLEIEKNKKYPGLVILHGSNHGSFAPEYFDLIEQAVARGYVVMFPEYSGSKGYGARMRLARRSRRPSSSSESTCDRRPDTNDQTFLGGKLKLIQEKNEHPSRERGRIMRIETARTVLCAVGMALGLARHAGAQAGTGALSGSVLDQTGGALPGVTVTLLEKGSATPRTTTSDSDGGFRFDGLGKADYELRAALSGFGDAVKAVSLGVGESRKLDLALGPRELSEQVVVTATRTPTEIAAIPGSVSVISRQAIIEQTLPTAGLGDTLGKLVPGLAGPNASNSQFGQTLRGRTLSVLIDGVPQSTTRNVQRDLETIAASAIERVEVLRGPTAIYGDGATGGVINIITRVPGAGPTQFSTDLDLSSSLTHPGDSQSGRFWQSAAGRKGNFDFSANGSYERVGGFFDGEGDRTPPDPNNQGGLADSDNVGLFGKFGLGSSKQRLQLTASHARRRQNTDYTTDPAVNSQAGHQKAVALFGLELDHKQGGDNTVASLDYRRSRVLATEAHAQAYYRDYTTTFYPRDSRALAARGNIINQSFIESTKKGGRLEFTTSLAGARRPVILWGFDAAIEDTAQPVWVIDPVAYDASRGRIFHAIGRRSWTPPMNQKNLAGFAHVEWKPVDRLALRAGLRHESIKVDVADFTVLQGFDITGGKLDYKSTPLNAGFVVAATRDFNFFFNFSQGFSIADIGLVLRAAPRGFSVGRLKPEAQNVDNYEVGLRLNRGSAAATLSGFYNTSDLGVTFAPDLTMIRSPEKIYGVEATFDVHSGEKLHLGMTGTWLEGKNDADRDGVYAYLPGERIAPPKVTGYIDHQTTSRWRNRIQAVYNGARDRFGPQGQPDAIGRIGFGLAKVEPYVLVDAFSYVKAGKGTVRFAVQNALNRMYFPPVSQWSGTDATYAAAQGAVFSAGYAIRY